MTETYEIDPVHSQIGFAVKHMMVSTVRGQFRQFAGTIELPDGETTGARAQFTIQAASIDTGNAARDEHLRSADFFAAAENPELTFRSTRIDAVGGDRYRADGELTMRGVTHPVSLEVEVGAPIRDPFGNQRVGLTARGKVNRRQWGLNWNQAIEAGGVVVSDEVRLEIEAALIKAQAEQVAA